MEHCSLPRYCYLKTDINCYGYFNAHCIRLVPTSSPNINQHGYVQKQLQLSMYRELKLGSETRVFSL